MSPTKKSSQRRSAVAKRDGAAEPVVKTMDRAMGSNYPPGRMLIASPQSIEAAVMAIPRGQVLTLPALRARLAKQFKADYTCPITTGIFLRIAAEAALEEGRADAVPVWRVVRENGACLDKLPGGPEAQAARLAKEGVPMTQRRGKWYVAEQ